MLSKNRDLVKDKWDNALAESAKMGMESEVPRDRKIPAFTFINICKILLILSFESTLVSICAQTLSRLTVQSDLGLIALLIMIVSIIIFSFLIKFVTKKLIANANPTSQIKSFAKCILKTLKDIDIIESACSLKVKNDPNGMFINVSLVNATIREQNIFNKAIAEFLSPIDNQDTFSLKGD